MVRVRIHSVATIIVANSVSRRAPLLLAALLALFAVLLLAPAPELRKTKTATTQPRHLPPLLPLALLVAGLLVIGGLLAGSAGEVQAQSIDTSLGSWTVIPGDTKVTVNWTVTGTGYVGYRHRHKETSATTWGAWQDRAVAPSHQFSGLTTGVSYDFELQARNSSGPSGDVLAFTAIPPGNPGAVQNLQATPAGGRVTFTWEPPVNDGGSPITGYRGKWSRDVYTVKIGPTVRTRTYRNLTNGVEVTFAIHAENAQGLGPPTTIKATPEGFDNFPPSGKPKIKGTARVGETLRADTSENFGDADGLGPLSYQWQATQGTTTVNLPSATLSTLTLTADHVWTEITVVVSYRDLLFTNESVTSSPVWVLRSLDDQRLGSTGDGGVTDVVGIHSQPFTPGSSVGLTAVTFAGDEGYDCNKYGMFVKATDMPVVGNCPVDADNDGVWDDVALPDFDPAIHEIRPDEGTGSVDISSAAAFRMTLQTDDQGNPSGTELAEFIKPPGWRRGHNQFVLPACVALAAGTRYHLVVVAEAEHVLVETTSPGGAWHSLRKDISASNIPGTSWIEQTGHAYATSLHGPNVCPAAQRSGLPAAPADLTAAVSGETQIDLSWSEPAGEPTGYSVEWSADGETEWTAADPAHSGTATEYSDTGVAGGTTRHYRVRATNDAGTGPWSEVTSATTNLNLVYLPPDTPQNLSAAAASASRIDLSWTAVDAEPEVTGYAVERSADGETGWTPVDPAHSGAGTQYGDTGLDAGTTYSYRVRATNDAGSGPWSAVADATTNATLAADPHAPQEAQAANTPATGAPSITGTTQVGETLTADTSGIADADGMDGAEFSYQWQADDTDIGGGTGETYTLAEADTGKVIKVRVSFTDDAGNEETLTSAATAAVEAKPNAPATGMPTIGGAAQVGETLTANTSGIADADGLTNVAFSYQWQVDGADLSGATGSTYTLADADEGKTVGVSVSFTDDAGNDETLTSAATSSVAGLPPPPLTVSVENAAASHDGETAFTFELRFSEELGISYKRLRDHAFTVTGGAVKKAKRMEQGSNVRWRITVRPDGNGDVTVVLPETTDCNDDGAICAPDGRMLSNRLELTLSGPGG